MATLDGVPGLSSSDGLKRGSDHFMSNMTDDYLGEQKRAKLDNSRPSKVLHIRQLPYYATEADVITLGIPFGKVTNVLKLPPPNRDRSKKGQALLEMEDEAKATSMVTYYAYAPATIRGETVRVQYSTHTELKTDPNKQSPVIANLLAAAAAATSGELQTSMDNTLYSATTATSLTSAASSAATSAQSLGMSNVLRVVIDNMLYPVSIDALHIIFSKYGTVIKIVICTKTNQFQVFVQYPDHVAANAAKTALDGQNIYNGCCTMKIGFSKFTDLNVKYNNDKTRDFSRPDLPSGEGQPAFDPNLGLSALGAAAGLLNNPLLAAAAAASVPSPLGLLGAGNILQGMGSTASLTGPTLDVNTEGDSARNGGAVGRGGTPVLLVSQLNAERIKCDDLFTLFGAFGDVVRVKILFNKPDTALIQFSDGQQAQIARENLNGVPFQGQKVKVVTSKHSSISLPKENADGAHLTRDYANSSIHRFRKFGSKNYQNIFPPSRTLHLSNIPSTQTEETLKTLFASRTTGSITRFEFFSKDSGKDKRMALIEMSSIEEAVQALVDLHDVPIGDNNHLRVSFARKSIRA